ncbi:heparan-alpha-glucosaminide N-acetyltransferase [Hydrogenophaga palleronii]|uniref:heparan-alpha-glucosaminide N-acetyltransferase n=1 Tax=Hydrogenophaga palleronii TaxID=65655 RepID=UPI000825C54F|nr:heparan-alpha-glucosaminide N-acetyltransferase [Hydrogenophaga palleronii]
MKAVAAPQRLDRIDLLRAVAMLWMTAFHLCFDLDFFGFINQDFYRDPLWTGQRTAIVSLFLFTAGLSQAVAVHQGQSWARFWKRWCQVAAAALLVTAGSVVMFPHSFIYFGVLHGIAVMLILVRLTAGWGVALWWLGAAAIALKFAAPLAIAAWPVLEVLNTPVLNWLGLISVKPITEDYVPLLPWLGVMWWGMAAGQWALRHRPRWLGTADAPARGLRRGLVTLGRWSLLYYLLHQPVLIGLVGLAAMLR